MLSIGWSNPSKFGLNFRKKSENWLSTRQCLALEITGNSMEDRVLTGGQFLSFNEKREICNFQSHLGD